MSTNKSISYLLCNKGIIVNLYKLHFLSSHFSFQPNKRVFHSPIFPSLQPNTHEGKLNIFHPPTFSFSHDFSSTRFSTLSTKRTLRGPFLAEKFSSFHDLFQGILAQKIPRLAELFAYIAWSIWHNRNAREWRQLRCH